MFHIHIFLNRIELNGIQALDFCRSKGLPDSVTLYKGTASVLATCPVDEGFARSWFAKDTLTNDEEFVDVDMLVPGELVLIGQRLDFSELPETRIKELFIAAKFRRLTKTG